MTTKKRYDDLDTFIEDQTDDTKDFVALVDEGVRLRELVRELATQRVELGLSQRDVARLLGTAQSVVARLESFDVEPRFTTLNRYAHALGLRIDWQLHAA